jgi:hypothetical protein
MKREKNRQKGGQGGSEIEKFRIRTEQREEIEREGGKEGGRQAETDGEGERENQVKEWCLLTPMSRVCGSSPSPGHPQQPGLTILHTSNMVCSAYPPPCCCWVWQASCRSSWDWATRMHRG